MRWRLIAGRGQLGDMNWGVDHQHARPLSIILDELVELKKHIGEKVLLTGGGGYGTNIAILKGAEIVKQGYIRNQPGLKVYLTIIKGPMMDYNQKTWKKTVPSDFDPWIDSWQISVKERSNPMKKVSMKVHPEVVDYLKRVKGDAKAGHTDAEEYWKGAAAGALIAGATNPKRKCPRCGHLRWRRIWVRGRLTGSRQCAKCGLMAHDNPGTAFYPVTFPGGHTGALNPMKPMPPEMNPRVAEPVIVRVEKRCVACGGVIPALTRAIREEQWRGYIYYHPKCFDYHRSRWNPLPDYPWIPQNIHAQRNPFWADAGTGLGLGLGWSAAAVAVKAVADAFGKKRKKK